MRLHTIVFKFIIKVPTILMSKIKAIINYVSAEHVFV